MTLRGRRRANRRITIRNDGSIAEMASLPAIGHTRPDCNLQLDQSQKSSGMKPVSSGGSTSLNSPKSNDDSSEVTRIASR